MKKAKKIEQREPSQASLREIPEIEFSKARVRRNPYAARIARGGIAIQVGRGRPRKLLEVGGTRPRSVRFPEAVWKKIAARAKAKGITVHAALREAILAWLSEAPCEIEEQRTAAAYRRQPDSGDEASLDPRVWEPAARYRRKESKRK